VVGNSRSFLAAHFKISEYTSVKMDQKLETEIVIKCCFKTESFAITVDGSHSVTEKSSVCNKPTKGFISQ